jgi:hypothetical protein
MATEQGSQRFEIEVRAKTHRLARRTLHKIQRDAGTQYRGQALEMACAQFLATPSEGPHTAEDAAEHHSRRNFPYHLYPDQKEVVEAALARAKQELNSEDGGEAFHHILVTVNRSYFGNVNFREPTVLDSAWSGRKGEAGSDIPASPTPRDRGESTSSDPHPTRKAEEDCRVRSVIPYVDHHLKDMTSASSVDLRPASAPSRPSKPGGTSKVECDGRQDRPRSTLGHHDDGGGAQAIFSRGSQCAEHGNLRDGNRPRELGGPLPRFPFGSVAALAHALEVTEDFLRELARTADQLYQPGWLLKPSGEWRPINEPEQILKDVQERLLHWVFDPIGVPSPIAFGVPSPIAFGLKDRDRERDYIADARQHERKGWVAQTDIRKFFDRVTSQMVSDLFRAMGCGANLTAVLAQLTTHQRALPQGVPTSAAIANFLLADLDHEAHRMGQRLRVTVTRFIDGYGLSGEERDAVLRVRGFIERRLEARGLPVSLDPKKRRLDRRDKPQIVHGLTVNNGVAVPKPYRKALAREVRLAEQRGCTEDERERLSGRIAYVAQLHRKLGRRLRAALRHARQVPAGPKRKAGRARRRTRRARRETFGAAAERQAARGHSGARRTIASGRFPFDPGDYKVGDYLFECKATLKPALSIKHSWLNKIVGEALSSAKTPAFEMRFCTGELGGAQPGGEWIGIPTHTWAELIEHQGDGPEFLIENRTVGRRSSSVRLNWLRGLTTKAADQEKAAAFRLQFSQNGKQPRGFGDWMFIEKHRWKQLTETSGGGEAPQASHPCRSST